jgi:hypothetical protein
MISTRVGVASNNVSRQLLLRQSRILYSTERIVELRSGKSRDNLPKALYDPVHEKDNCGVGLIASLKSIPSRGIVEKADEMLVRMAHRGGCGCDPASGDGSGKIFSVSYRYMFVIPLTDLLNLCLSDLTISNRYAFRNA